MLEYVLRSNGVGGLKTAEAAFFDHGAVGGQIWEETAESLQRDKQQDALVDRMVETSNPKAMSTLETKIAKLEEDKLLLTDKPPQNTKPKSTLTEIIE